MKTHLGGALELFSSIPQLSIQVFEELGCDSRCECKVIHKLEMIM